MKNSSFSGMPEGGDRRSRKFESSLPLEGDEAVHEIFNDVPQSEIRVEKPLLCTYGNGAIGHLHITRNYLCWNSSVSTRKIVIHFSEIKSVEKGSTLIGSIEVKTATGRPAARDCQSEPMHDWGPGIARCNSCGAQPCWNRGCKSCDLKLCKTCFDKHRAEPGEEVARHLFKTRDLDRIFIIIKNLWAAHLRIPKAKRPVRAPSAMSQTSTELAEQNVPTIVVEEKLPNYHSTESEEALLTHISDVLCSQTDTVLTSHFPPTSTRETTALLSGASENIKASLEVIYKSLEKDVILSLHVSRKDEKVVIPPWITSEDKSTGVRMISYLTSTPIGKKQIQEAQRYWWSADSLCLETSAQCAGVPCGGSFRTVIFYEFKKSDTEAEVSLRQWGGQPYILKSLGMMSGQVKRAVAKACEENATGMIKTLHAMVRARMMASQPAREGSSSSVDPESELLPDSNSPVTPRPSSEGDALEVVGGYLRLLSLASLFFGILISYSASDSTSVRFLPLLSSTSVEVTRLTGDFHINISSTDALYDTLYYEVHRNQWTSMSLLMSGFFFACFSLLSTLSANSVVKEAVKGILSSVGG